MLVLHSLTVDIMGYKVLSALLAIALVFVIAVSAEIRPYDGEHGVHERHYPRDFWNRAVSDNYVLFPVRDSNVSVDFALFSRSLVSS